MESKPELSPVVAATLKRYLEIQIMDLIGSPSADKVRAAIEQGTVRKEDFAGAFRKTTKRLVAVSKHRPDDVPETEPM